MDREYELILTVVNRGFSDDVMEAARSAGASGGTILHARGSGVHEMQEFFGISIQPEKEIVMILVPHALSHAVLQSIRDNAGLSKPGRGLVFALPVDDVVGIMHKLEKDNA